MAGLDTTGTTDGAAPAAHTVPASYGFGGHLSRVFPSQVIVDVTECCNLACTHCPHPSFKRSPHYEGRMLDAALVSKAVGEIAAAGAGIVQHVRFTSEGEPLLHRHITDMLSDAVARSGTFVSLTTNGALLTAVRAERLLATGVHLVDISIDAFSDETYARIRVGGHLAVTRENVVRLLARARASGAQTRIVVSYVEQQANRHETADFERFWRGVGADDVVIRRQHSAAGAVIPVARVLRERVAPLARRPCVYPWERIVLNPRGMLCFCPADWTHGSSMVDFRTISIQEAWHGPFYEALRAAHVSNDFHRHPFCGQCPDWQETRWPHEGSSYATLVTRLREHA